MLYNETIALSTGMSRVRTGIKTINLARCRSVAQHSCKSRPDYYRRQHDVNTLTPLSHEQKHVIVLITAHRIQTTIECCKQRAPCSRASVRRCSREITGKFAYHRSVDTCRHKLVTMSSPGAR